jgi:NAD+ synthase (glutamine-hydrolysing)
MKISMNQINTVSGDIKGNYKNILNRTNIALNDGADIIVFPEVAFTAYCVGALWDNMDFIFEQENCVRELMRVVPYNKCVIVGYISYHGTKPDGFPLLKNSVAVINKNRIQRYDKQLLANADHHEDRKYFKPGKESKVFKLLINEEEVTVGVPICEDSWYINHERNIPKEMVDLGAEILISINQSYFYYNKQQIRTKLFSTISSDLKVPVLALNSVGVGDIVKNIIIFDGSSMVFDSTERCIQMKRFQEDTFIVNLRRTSINKIKVNRDSVSLEYQPNEFDNKYDEIIDAISFEQKELFKLLGIPNAQVHISGGVDSAIGMALSVLSMGKENCVFITNPTSLNSDSLPVVHQLAENLGVDIHVNELEEIYQIFNKKDTENFGSELNTTGQATIQAVLRSVQGLAACHRFKSGIVACGNHTEIVLGWASFHDIGSIGVHSPIGDLTKLELFELCKQINTRFFSLGYVEHVIPEDLFNGRIRPAAELPDSKYDPIDYYIQSGLCAEVIRNRKTKSQLITDFENKRLTKDFFPDDIYEKYSMEQFVEQVDFTLRKSRISVFKAAQAAPIVILSPRSRGFSNRETIINKYQ